MGSRGSGFAEIESNVFCRHGEGWACLANCPTLPFRYTNSLGGQVGSNNILCSTGDTGF